RTGGPRAHGGFGLLHDRSVEAGTVDRPDDLLDRAAALRARLQAAVHVAAAVPGRRSAQGTRRQHDARDATRRARRFPLSPPPVWLAGRGGPAVQDYPASPLLLVPRRSRPRTCREY